MKSSVAFAVGLWTGGLVVGVVWAVHYRLDQSVMIEPSLTSVTAADAPTDPEYRELRQANAYLAAERERLSEALNQVTEKETLAERRAARRHRRLSDGEIEPDPETIAVLEAGDLRDLTRLALANDAAALEAITQAAQNGQLALLRVWQSGRLNETNYLAITGYVHALLDQLAAEWTATGMAESMPVIPEPTQEPEADTTAQPVAPPVPATEATPIDPTESELAEPSYTEPAPTAAAGE